MLYFPSWICEILEGESSSYEEPRSECVRMVLVGPVEYLCGYVLHVYKLQAGSASGYDLRQGYCNRNVIRLPFLQEFWTSEQDRCRAKEYHLLF